MTTIKSAPAARAQVPAAAPKQDLTLASSDRYFRVNDGFMVNDGKRLTWYSDEALKTQFTYRGGGKEIEAPGSVRASSPGALRQLTELVAARPVTAPQRLPSSFAAREVFDAGFYKEHHGDVYRAYVATLPDPQKNSPQRDAGWNAFAEEHWLTFGAREGRQGSSTFSATWAQQAYAPNLDEADADADLARLGMLSSPEKTIETWLSLPPTTRASLVTAPNPTGDRDLGFGAHGLKLDVYSPPTRGKQLTPVVISLPGGGFIDADKRSPPVISQANAFAEKGIAVVVAEYRVTDFKPENINPGDLGSHKPGDSTVKWPEPQNDLRDALAFVKANAEKYGWDLSRVTLLGGSASSNIVLNTVLDGEAAVKVKNVIIEAPATDFTRLPPAHPVNKDLSSWLDAYLPGGVDRAQASPLKRLESLAANRPEELKRLAGTAVFMNFSKDDHLTDYAGQVEPFAKLLGDRVTLDERRGEHGSWLDPASENYDPRTTARMIEWLGQQG